MVHVFFFCTTEVVEWPAEVSCTYTRKMFLASYSLLASPVRATSCCADPEAGAHGAHHVCPPRTVAAPRAAGRFPLSSNNWIKKNCRLHTCNDLQVTTFWQLVIFRHGNKVATQNTSNVLFFFFPEGVPFIHGYNRKECDSSKCECFGVPVSVQSCRELSAPRLKSWARI
jgi:hypothetical protein